MQIPVVTGVLVFTFVSAGLDNALLDSEVVQSTSTIISELSWLELNSENVHINIITTANLLRRSFE